MVRPWSSLVPPPLALAPHARFSAKLEGDAAEEGAAVAIKILVVSQHDAEGETCHAPR